MADIFLSYKREDRDKVRPLVEALQAQGWSVWWDTRIGVGETWDRVIETELAAAKCVVVVWSKVSVESRWVRSEAHEGLERECVIPVIIERVKPPLAFRLVQSTDLTNWRGDASDAEFADVAAGVRRTFQESSATAAIGEYTKAIEIDPKDVDSLLRRGQAHLAKKDYVLAIADFTKAIESTEGSRQFLWSVYRARAQAYEGLGDGDSARADHRAAFEIEWA